MTRLSADYSLLRNRDTEYAWRVDAGIDYVKQDDKYILPASSMDSENACKEIHILCAAELLRVFSRCSETVIVGGHIGFIHTGEVSDGGRRTCRRRTSYVHRASQLEITGRSKKSNKEST